ncbi:MAG: diguanylate cyclase [Syntrophomonadaceae bacterium]
MRILIAEDEPISRKLLQNSLLDWGYDVVVARDGQEALTILEKDGRPNLAVLDWMMPGADGPDICRWLRSRETASYVYVILLTGRNQEGDLVRGLESGADDYMLKPFNSEELKYRLRIGQRIIEQEQKIIRMASIDDLTGLLNRRNFWERMEKEMNRLRREKGTVGFIISDIDHFKNVNDTYGHSVGDLVLQQFAQCLQDNCRIYDYVGRYGGDEFIIGVPGASLLETVEIAERIRNTIQNTGIPILGSGDIIQITASFGVDAMNLGSENEQHMEELINHADEALYLAKGEGRNRIGIYSSANRQECS